MADVTIEASLEEAACLHTKKGGIIWTSSTVGYQFYIENTGSPAGPLKYRKTSDGGQTWGSGVTVNSASIARFSCWYDKETAGDTGTKIHTVCGSWDDNHAYYRNLDTASDTLSSSIDIGDMAGVGDANGSYSVGYCSLTKARGGNLYMAYVSDNGPVLSFFRSTDGGANWGSRTGPFESTNLDRVMLLPAADTDSNDIACIFYDQSASQLSFKLHDDSANTWGNETAIASSITYAAEYWGFDAAVRHSDNRAIVAYWNGEDAATADLAAAVLTLTAAGKNSTLLTEVLTNVGEAGECCVMIDGNTDDLYVGYVKGGTWDSLTHTFYKKSTDSGSTWGSESALSETQDDIRNIFCVSIIASGQAGRFMPSWPNDDLNDLVTNYANSVSISAGGGGTTTRRYSLSLTGVG
jgi:hypothetical protein